MRFAILVLAAWPALSLASEPPAAKIAKGETTLEFLAGPDVVSKYQFAGTVQVEKGTETKPLAKPFFFPMLAPGKVPVTRDWPMIRGAAGETVDHFHQKSGWFCHGDLIPDGVELKVKAADKHVKGVDFWAETANHGRIVTVDVGEPKQVSPNHAMIATRNRWQAADETPILDEIRVIHFVTLPDGYLFAIDTELTPAAGPITFGDTKEGAMGIRVRDEIRAGANTGNGTLTNADGKTGEKEIWGYPSAWVDNSGTVDGKAGGIAVFDHPKNPYPASWHARGYGLVAANPFGREKSGFPSQKGKTDLVKLDKGQKLKLRYGIYTHAGNAEAGKVAAAHAAFAAMK